ncbi:hypothetical protein CPB83DRAFT_663485 [Crepidotus variabilis]|uniref:Protein kinase domain-containing protein n=1 Tax=Crepidotus variabilis TaxID=179855 RepID=A0A9P6ENN6_9AGAR|nr:hypothetical protein CPB83DRAFT_663485 [Crepidotus variabilis]
MPSNARKKRNRYQSGRNHDVKARTKMAHAYQPPGQKIQPRKGQLENFKTEEAEVVVVLQDAVQEEPDNTSAEDDHYSYRAGSLLSVDFYPEPFPSTHQHKNKSQVHEEHTADNITSNRHGATTQPIRLTVKVAKTFSTTLSCALLVSISPKQLESATNNNAAESALHNLFAPRNSHLLDTASSNDAQNGAPDILAVLKLCDRRFSRGVREDYCAKPWTPDIEQELEAFEALNEDQKPEVSIEEGNDSWHYEGNPKNKREETRSQDDLYVKVDQPRNKSKSIAQKMRKSKSTTGTEKREPIRVIPKDWSDGHREAYMQKKCDRHCDTEVSIYRHVRSLQGKQIPMLYGTVELRLSSYSSAGAERDRRRGGAKQIRGMLMEYIHPAFPLREVLTHISDPKKWQEVGETAVRIVQVVGDRGVLNQDVRLDNVLIVPVEGGYQEDNNILEEDENDDDDMINIMESREGTKYFRAVMIDFGLARLRREDETQEAWRKARRLQDEEGAIGYVFEKHLWKSISTMSNKEPEEKPFKYRPSGRLMRSWDNDEEDM